MSRARIEGWAATNLLTLPNNPGEITRRGAGHEEDSTINLASYNEAAKVLGHLHRPTPEETVPGFIIDLEKK